jgi:hypothetical protein
MPRLELTLEGLPAEAAAGELLRLQVRDVDMICDDDELLAVCRGGGGLTAVAAAGELLRLQVCNDTTYHM